MLKEVIGCSQELMVMDENVCELIRRGVNGLSARLLHFVILRWEKWTPHSPPLPKQIFDKDSGKDWEQKESGNLWYGELACLLY